MTRTALFLTLLLAGPMAVQATDLATPDSTTSLRRFALATTVPWIAVLWLAPGLLLVGRRKSATETVLRAWPLAFAIQILAVTAARAANGGHLTDETTRWLQMGLALAAVAVALRRKRRIIELPIGAVGMIWSIGFVTILVLFPFLFDQNANDDGLEALYIGESLRDHALPRWPTPGGLVGFGVGMLPSAFANHAFIAWLGPVPAAPRLPMILALSLLLPAVLRCVQSDTGKRAGPLERIAGIGVLAVTAAALALQAGYNPYFADAASPAAYDLLLIACFVAAFASFLDRRPVSFVTFCVVGAATRPTMVLLCLLVAAAAALVAAGQRRRYMLWFGGAVLGSVALAMLHEKFYVPMATDDAPLAYDSGSVISRYRFLTWSEPRRLLLALIPGGIVPILCLVFMRGRRDVPTRVLTVVTGAYFAAFYIPAFISLHHFVPVMVLPLVVIGRMAMSRSTSERRIWASAVLAGVAVAAWLTIPARTEPDRTYRELGQRVAITSEVPSTGRHPRDLSTVLRPLADHDDAERNHEDNLVGTPWLVWHHARRGAIGEETDWAVTRLISPVPKGFEEIYRTETLRLVQRNGASTATPPVKEYRSFPYIIHRDVLHRFRGEANGRFDIDLRDWIGR